MKDAANVNDCIVCREQAATASRRLPGRYRFHVDVNCQSHQACLLNRGALDGAGDLSTVLVRLGHVVQSGKQKASFQTELDHSVEDIHQYRAVLVLPANTDELKEAYRRMLRPSVLCGDLTDADVEAMVDHDNGGPGAFWIHFCLVGRCKSGCVDEASSLQNAKLLARRSLGRLFTPPLAYRWKGMDFAMIYTGRGRWQHELLPRTLRKMFTSKRCEEALLAAEAVAPELLSFQAKCAVKAASVLRYFDCDSDSRMLNASLIITGPLQHMLNASIASDKTSTRLTIECSYDPTSHAATVARLEACKMNYRFLSGEAGNTVIYEYTCMLLDTTSTAWRDMRQDHLLKSCLMIVRIIVNSWMRAVLYFDDPRFKLLCVCSSNGGSDFTFNFAHVDLE